MKLAPIEKSIVAALMEKDMTFWELANKIDHTVKSKTIWLPLLDRLCDLGFICKIKNKYHWENVPAQNL